MFAGAPFAAGYFAGVLAAGVALPEPPDPTIAGITLDDVDIKGRVRLAGVTIHDILNDAPNTCALVIEGTAPAVGQRLRITLSGGAVVLFAGALQTVDESFEGTPRHVAWSVTAIDDTARANARRPFGTWVDVSATTIAQAITATFAPGFLPAGIEAGLPPVRIVFDGADTFIACLTRLASAIGGYCKIADNIVYLFLTDTAAAPDPIDQTPKRFLHDPPIRASRDSSQLRTRVYGKGYGEAIQADLAAGETLIPIEDGAQFTAAGGQAIAGVTADGAQSERLTYTGVDRPPGGTLVGPGAAPTTAPGVSLVAGGGVESGVHDYAFVFVTASGTSLPSPRAPITVGPLPAPATAPTAGIPYSGPGNLAPPGAHRYYALFRTATGTTLAGPPSNTATVGVIAAPTTIGYAEAPVIPGDPSADLTPGGTYSWKYTFRRLADNVETAPSPASNPVVANGKGARCQVSLAGCQAPPPGFVRHWYRTKANGSVYYRHRNWDAGGDFLGESGNAYLYDGNSDNELQAATPPSTVLSTGGSIPLTNIPVGAAGLVTHVDIYREYNNAGPATARFLTSQPNGTTSLVDGLANEQLGGLMPTTNTTSANQVRVSWPAGPAAVTNINIYRTTLGDATLRFAGAAGGNAAGSFVDGTPDASLGPAAPTSDTSALQQPSGQVNPGATALPVASAAPFRSGGGWVQLAGEQYARYTGISASSLIGIPATGAGAITTTVIYGSPALPAATLLGVTGVTVAIRKGAAIHIWVQRDDLAAQAEQAARAGGDGVVEYVLADTRRGEPSLIARCDAELARFARPIVTVTYATRDVKTTSGKQVVIDLASPAIRETLTIQDVTITEIDQVPGVPPRFTVTASSVRFSLEDTLRRLIAGGQIVGGSS